MRAPARQLVIGLFAFFLVFAVASTMAESDRERRTVTFLGLIVEVGVLFALWQNVGMGSVAVPPLLSALRRAADGERPEAPAGSPPELVPLYEAIGEFAATGRRKLIAERQRYQELLETQRGVEGEVLRLGEALRGQTSAVDEAMRAVREMSSGGGETAKHVELLASSAEESSSSILEITATNEEVAENTAELARSVRETVSSIEEMAYSIKEVAKNVEALSLTAEETSSSMNEMDVSIDQVQSNANETARLSEEVAHDAEKGAEAILKTIGEIYRIKESSQEAVSVIANLGSRIEAIGQIVGVIDEVAEQTNLLALNAAILAAQSGEHGKGFAVVADEIKDLAERAGGSTKEIADLVKTIQAESRNAINAVERSSHNVERGVEVSNEAERALKKILESSQKSTNMVRAIARATVEQAKGSKQVTDAIGRIAETVQQIAAATAQQARGSELIMKSAEKMRTITQHVERSSQEQARGSRQITQNIEGISNLVGLLTSAQKNQSRETGQALAASSRIEDSVRAQEQALKQLSSALEGLRRVTSDLATRGDGDGLALRRVPAGLAARDDDLAARGGARLALGPRSSEGRAATGRFVLPAVVATLTQARQPNRL